jgi:hypothetical protein
MSVRRKIILPVDALLEIVKDYTRETHDLPYDTVPVSLQIKPTEKGMFGLMVQSEQFKDDTPIRVNFDIKKVFTV